MASIWFIKHETDFGPFFSTKEKAIKYLIDDDEEMDERRLKAILENRDPYVAVVEVELDDADISFDG